MEEESKVNPNPPPPSSTTVTAASSFTTSSSIVKGGNKKQEADLTILDYPEYICPNSILDLNSKQDPIHLHPFHKDSKKAKLLHEKIWCCKRGEIDVSGIKRKLVEGGEDIWSDKLASETNVAVTRPAHDAWEIRKIIFIFCDDFLKRCYELPWWHMNKEWKELICPIFEQLKIPESKIVRCLLASMPPGLQIPVHHDTGYWVNYTHRVHVPIITDTSKVIFLSGADENNLKRIRFGEGEIIELNNQAKHAVHNCWDQYRTHLIFDYVEDFAIERMQLRPGQQIVQTRRTIDLIEEAGSRPLPWYMILGAQKSGTTSMYEYITQHPLVLKARRRETHALDWRWDTSIDKATEENKETDQKEKDIESLSRETVEFYSQFFFSDQLLKHPSLVTGESTPSYLLHSDKVIPRIKLLNRGTISSVCHDSSSSSSSSSTTTGTTNSSTTSSSSSKNKNHFLVMLRDPVKRAFSHYQMVIDPNGTPAQKRTRGTHWLNRSFEDVVNEELHELDRLGITADSTYNDFKTKYLSTRPIGHGSHSLLGRGMYSLQLEGYLQQFNVNEFKIIFLEDLKSNVQETMNSVYEFLDLPSHKLADESAKNTREYSETELPNHLKEKLYRFFEPFDHKLQEIGEKYGIENLQRRLPWL